MSQSNQLINPKHLQRVPEPSNGLHHHTPGWILPKHFNTKLCGREKCASSRDDHSLESIVRKIPFKSVGYLHKS